MEGRGYRQLLAVDERCDPVSSNPVDCYFAQGVRVVSCESLEAVGTSVHPSCW